MKIDNLPPLRDIISKFDLNAKKSLGQNFLYDLNLTSKISQLNGSVQGHTVLEVGAGPGALTRGLLASGAKKVIAIEKDKRFIEPLKEIAEYHSGKLIIIKKDALEFDLNEITDTKNLKIISNLPYNIGSELLVKWLTPQKWPPLWKDMTLMFQKEVADRIVAKPNTKAYGRLSILSQWRTTAKIKMLVPPEAFKPTPKVQSAIVTINADQKIDYTISHALLERIVKLGFGQRRKMLRSSLKSYNNIEFHIKNIGLLPTLRAENLSVTDWCCLAKSIAVAEKLT